MIEIRLKTDKVEAKERKYCERSYIEVESVSSEYDFTKSIQVYVSDTPGICINDNLRVGGYTQLIVSDDYILLEGDIFSMSLIISIDPNMYYIEVDAKESDNKEWLYMTATIKRKDN